ncbi:Carnitine O-acetyltransferase [Strongyloides ratti]|uniref:Carnitine O-acetyltransferase n=1 Tax=Strongyloides ratti TaxID=34506 RepID=A0A090KWU3_STRRB|nr:Carnitine O-acetyltransferase [Strongyloides ratti]CEF61980.1 Carnitine O-acetyltransferase [Strongyloides ratti]
MAMNGIMIQKTSNTFFRSLYLKTFSMSSKKYFGTPELQKIGNNGLPKLTVPPLEDTLNKFILMAKPIVDEEEFIKTRNMTNDFKASEIGKKLQKYLKDREDKLNNWLTPWWLDIAYLEGRDPLPIVTSPGMLFPYYNYKGIDGQIEYASKFIQSVLKYHHLIIENKIPQDKIGNTLFEMSQYKNLFGTTRIPRKKKDELILGYELKEWSKHIIVIRRGHAFKVPVYDKNGNILSINNIIKILKNNVIPISNSRNPFPVLSLSALDRETWAIIWKKMENYNPEYVNVLLKSLFVVNLDETVKFDNYKSQQNAVVSEALTGGGCDNNSLNRWYDKTLQYNITPDGYCTCTYEHTPAEGPPVGSLCDYICDTIEKNNFNIEDNNIPCDKVERLDFKIDDDMKNIFKDGIEKINKSANNLDVNVYYFKEFGKNFPKQVKLSPDSFIQLAFQLTFYRIHKKHPPTYETGTLRKFSEGRTETIRLPTIDTAKFVETFVNNKTSDDELSKLLIKAIESHKEYSIMAMNGRGIDRHLLGLRLASRELFIPLPNIFKGEAYKKMMHFQVSTSQVPTRHYLSLAFGPSAPDCYGICYNPKEKEIIFTITTFKECKDTSSQQFTEELHKTLCDLRNILLKTVKIEKAKL